MLTTETAAHSRWCPYVRHVDDDGGTFNRGFFDAVNASQPNGRCRCSCIGSACMMWRWAEQEDPPEQRRSDTPVEGWEHVTDTGFGKHYQYWLEPLSQAQERKGWCGMAGRPDNA